MNLRGALVLVAVIAVGAATWIALRPAPAADVAEPAPAVEAPEARPPTRVVAPAATEGARSEPVAAEPAEPVASGPSEPAADGWTARVVDATGAPRERVPVSLRVTSAEVPLGYPASRALTAAGHGEAVLPLNVTVRPEQSLGLAIELPLDPFVMRDAGAKGSVTELVLPPAAEGWLGPLEVHVTTPAGEPVPDVDVSLYTHPLRNPDDRDFFGRRTTTSAAGVAALAKHDWVAKIFQLGRFDPTGARAVGFGCAVRGLFQPWAAAPVTTPPPAGPVRLVLPPTAAVVVRTSRADGSPMNGAAVTLSAWAHGERIGHYLEGHTEDGAVRFGPVGLDLELELIAERYGLVSTARRPGPVVAGETLEVELFLTERPRLTARLLDEDGSPMEAGMWFDGTLTRRSASPDDAELRLDTDTYIETDTEGRIDIEVTLPPGHDEWLLTLIEKPDAGGHLRGPVRRVARPDRPLPGARNGRIDLGDLVLRGPPVILSGRVLQADGQPARGATVTIEYAAGSGAHEEWVELSRLHGEPKSDADGRFEIHATETTRLLRAQAVSSDFRMSPTAYVEPGSTVELTLSPTSVLSAPTGWLTGSLQLDEGVLYDDLRVVVDIEGARHVAVPLATGFELAFVPAARFRCEVRTRGSGWLVHAVEGVVVEHDATPETDGETRLGSIDLRGRLRLLRLALHDEDGAPLAGARLQLAVAGDGGALAADEAGHLVALTRSADDAFTLAVPGFAPAEVSWSESLQVVALERE